MQKTIIMQNETGNMLCAFTGTTSGLLAGMYQTYNGGSWLHIILTTALTAAISCIVSFFIGLLLNKLKR